MSGGCSPLEALENAEKMEEQDVYVRACLLQNLGKVALRMGSVTEALENYDRAAALYDGADNMREMGERQFGTVRMNRVRGIISGRS